MPQLRVYGLVVILLVGSVCALAQGNAGQQPRTGGGAGVTHSLRGKLFMPSGQAPEMRVRVVLEITTGGIVGDSFTDSVGNFEFRSLSNGNYIIKVMGDDRLFDNTQETIEISGSFSRTFNTQIYLREKAKDPRNSTDTRMLSVADLQEVPKAARKPYDKGIKLAQTNKTQEAIAQFREALKLFPEYLHALNKLGEQLAQSGDLNAAQATFEQAITVNQRFALPHIGLGIIFNNQKRFAQAIEQLDLANQLDETFPLAHFHLGIALLELQPIDYSRAEKELSRALALGGKEMVYTYMVLFNLHLRQRQYAQAAAQLENYLKEMPNAPDAPQIKQRLEAIKKLIAQQSSSN